MTANRPDQQDFEYADSGEPLPLVPGSGVLEMHPNGYGFLRNPATNFTRERTDPFVPGTMIEKFGLREGLLLQGMVQRHRRGQGPRLKELLDVDGISPDDYTTVDDYREIWWDPNAISGQNARPGAWQQLNGGARWTPDNPPTGPANFFQP